MTGITLDREHNMQIQVTRLIIGCIAAMLMIAAVAGSVMLLDWAITDKFAKYEVAESSQITTQMRDQQLGCLAKNIYYEAGGEPFEGKVAVAQVTLNRVNSGKFPGDICKTIYQKNVIYDKVICQFSWTCDRVTGPPPVNRANYKESMEVAKKVLLEDFRLPSLKDAMYFHSKRVAPNRPEANRVATIGNHIFYK